MCCAVLLPTVTLFFGSDSRGGPRELDAAKGVVVSGAVLKKVVNRPRTCLVR